MFKKGEIHAPVGRSGKGIYRFCLVEGKHNPGKHGPCRVIYLGKANAKNKNHEDCRDTCPKKDGQIARRVGAFISSAMGGRVQHSGGERFWNLRDEMKKWNVRDLEVSWKKGGCEWEAFKEFTEKETGTRKKKAALIEKREKVRKVLRQPGHKDRYSVKMPLPLLNANHPSKPRWS